jgi:2,3-bisphosphoglycerate-independent phosphoglycerate mutase
MSCPSRPSWPRSADGFDARIASGGGRQNITMDRYEANWAWSTRAGTPRAGRRPAVRQRAAAVKACASAIPGTIDQDLPPFVIAEAGQPVGTIEDGDAVVFFNFRGDRAIEITRAFEEADFDKFDRVRVPRVTYAGMLQYDGDLKLPKRFLVDPPAISTPWASGSAKAGITQFACSETQKFGHVTYFWNGNRSNKFDGETYQEVPSDVVPFEQRPWMKAAEIADAMIAALKSGQYKTLRCNFANGDMVGHTGNFRAATMAIEAVDLELARILPVIDALGGVALITADHGNADEMYEIDKKTKQPAKQCRWFVQGQDRAHAQSGAADPLRQRQRRQAGPAADRNGRPVEHRRDDRQPARASRSTPSGTTAPAVGAGATANLLQRPHGGQAPARDGSAGL